MVKKVKKKSYKVGAGILAGGGSIAGIFYVLTTILGFSITGTNDFCSGTLSDPCVSDIIVCNPNVYDVEITNPKNVRLDFSPKVKDFTLFVYDEKCFNKCSIVDKSLIDTFGEGFCYNGCQNGYGVWFNNYRSVDINSKKLFNFKAKSCTNFKLWGLKNNPSDSIKWGFGTNDKLSKGYLDPTWFTNITDSSFYNIGNHSAGGSLMVNYSNLSNPTNISFRTKACDSWNCSGYLS